MPFDPGERFSLSPFPWACELGLQPTMYGSAKDQNNAGSEIEIIFASMAISFAVR